MAFVAQLSGDLRDTRAFSTVAGSVGFITTGLHAGLAAVEIANSGSSGRLSLPSTLTTPTLRFLLRPEGLTGLGTSVVHLVAATGGRVIDLVHGAGTGGSNSYGVFYLRTRSNIGAIVNLGSIEPVFTTVSSEWLLVEININDSTNAWRLHITHLLTGTAYTQSGTNADITGGWTAVDFILDNAQTIRFNQVIIGNSDADRFPKSMYLHTVRPSADDLIALSKFPNSGTNFSKVSAYPPDNDTTYVFQSATAAAADRYLLDDISLPANLTTPVKAIVIGSLFRSTAAAAPQRQAAVEVLTSTNTLITTTSSVAAATTYTYRDNQGPTTTGWSLADANGFKLRVNINSVAVAEELRVTALWVTYLIDAAVTLSDNLNATADSITAHRNVLSFGDLLNAATDLFARLHRTYPEPADAVDTPLASLIARVPIPDILNATFDQVMDIRTLVTFADALNASADTASIYNLLPILSDDLNAAQDSLALLTAYLSVADALNAATDTLTAVRNYLTFTDFLNQSADSISRLKITYAILDILNQSEDAITFVRNRFTFVVNNQSEEILFRVIYVPDVPGGTGGGSFFIMDDI